MLPLCYAAPLITGPLLLTNLPPVTSYNYLFVWTDLIIRNAINVCFYAALIKKCNSVSVCLADHLFKHSINRNRFHTKWMDDWFFSHSEKSGNSNFFKSETRYVFESPSLLVVTKMDLNTKLSGQGFALTDNGFIFTFKWKIYQHRNAFVFNWISWILICYQARSNAVFFNYSGQWGCIRCKHNVRWRYLSLMKVVSFLFIKKVFSIQKRSRLLSGISNAIYSWFSPIQICPNR